MALKIFLELVRKGQIHLEEAPELVQAYKTDSEVQGLLTNVMEPLAGVKILDSLYTLYLSPNLDNRVFGYTNEQLRQLLGLRDNRELYLAYFIILALLALFYGEDSLGELSRTYVTVHDLEQFVTGKLTDFAGIGGNGVKAEKGENQELEELEKELEINLKSSVELWQDMPEYDPELKKLRGTTKNRISFILKIGAFLQEEGLALVQQEREIYLTEKTEQMVRKYYSDRGRKDKLLTLLCARKEAP